MNATPQQVVNRMVTCYRANTLVLEKYNHPEFSISSLTNYLKANGIHFIVKKEKPLQGIVSKRSPVNHSKYFDAESLLPVAMSA